MLNSSLRTPACAKALHLSSTATCRTAFLARSLSLLSTPTPASRPTARRTQQRRANATFAQATDKVQLDRQETGEEVAGTTAADEGAVESAEEVKEETRIDAETAPVEVEESAPIESQENPTSPSALDVDASSETADEALNDVLAAIHEEVDAPTAPSTAEADDPYPSYLSSLAPSPTSPPLSSSTSTPTAPPPPTPPAPVSPPTPEEAPQPLRGLNLPSNGPQLTDLFSLRPKRFRLPTANSPDSHRLIYSKSWDAATTQLTRAFSKQQLFLFAGPDGLDLNLEDVRLRSATPGRKHKWWKSKRFDQMSKRELIHTILILEFGMVHPDTVVANPTLGPQTSEVLTLSNRTLFLLLSPNSPTILNIARQLGVKAQYRRAPDESGLIQLMLKGSQKSVDAAREQIEMVDELRTAERTTFNLPLPASTLRPEVYQSISRLSKVFLAPPSPSSPPHSLSAAAIATNSILRAERLLHVAFSAEQAKRSTALFASVPKGTEGEQYAMSPLEPLIAPSVLASGGTSSFARIQSLSHGPAPSSHLPDLLTPKSANDGETVGEFRERLALSGRTDNVRPALALPTYFSTGLTAKKAQDTTVVEMLSAPFSSPQEKVDVTARFGHVAWPIYESGGGKGMGPVKNGAGPFSNFAGWVRQQIETGARSVFVSSPPGGLLQSLGVLTPLPPTASAFSSLFSPFSTGSSAFSSTSPFPSDPSSSLSPQQLADLASHPSLSSTNLRRWVYRPKRVTGAEKLSAAEREQEEAAVSLVAPATPPVDRGHPQVRIEVEMETETLLVPAERETSGEDEWKLAGAEGEGEYPEADEYDELYGGGREKEMVRKTVVRKTTVKVVKENLVDLMVPNASVDVQLAMASSTVLDKLSYPEALTPIILSLNGSTPPVLLTHNNVLYMLDSDREIRRTVITPPSPPTPSADSDFDAGADVSPPPPPSPPAFAKVQENWTSLWPSPPHGATLTLDSDGLAARGVDVFLALTSPSETATVTGTGSGAVGVAEVKERWNDWVGEVEGACGEGRGEKRAVDSLRSWGRR